MSLFGADQVRVVVIAFVSVTVFFCCSNGKNKQTNGYFANLQRFFRTKKHKKTFFNEWKFLRFCPMYRSDSTTFIYLLYILLFRLFYLFILKRNISQIAFFLESHLRREKLFKMRWPQVRLLYLFPAHIHTPRWYIIFWVLFLYGDH